MTNSVRRSPFALVARLALLPCALVLLAAFAPLASAQNLPTGVVGGVPLSTIQRRPDIRFAKITGTAFDGRFIQFSLPINGLRNYVFFTLPDGSFLPGGDYQVEYLNEWRGHVEFAGTAHYNPGTTFTATSIVSSNPLNSFFNGEPQPPNAFAGPTGIFGFVTLENDSTGTVTALNNKLVTLRNSAGQIVSQVRTNANGFYAFYYLGENFLPPGDYTVSVSHVVFRCIGGKRSSRTETQQFSIHYSPDNTVEPLRGDRSYFVSGAQRQADFFFFTQTSCGIIP